MSRNLRTLLIDDETNATSALNVILNEFAENLEVVGIANSAKHGLELIKSLQPDIVFLDIQLPHMTGIEMLETLDSDRNFEVVFLTAHNNYAQEAFRQNAFYYLLKPVHIPDMLAVVNKLQEKIFSRGEEQKKSSMTEIFRNRISISSSEGIEFIPIEDIIRIEAAGSYVTLYIMNRKPTVASKNLKSIEELLVNHPFFRAHKSHLINVQFIQKYVSYKDGGCITMIDGSEIDLSRNHKDEFISLYKL